MINTVVKVVLIGKLALATTNMINMALKQEVIAKHLLVTILMTDTVGKQVVIKLIPMVRLQSMINMGVNLAH